MQLFYPLKTTLLARLLSIHSLLKALPHYRTSYYTIPLGNSIYILVYKVIKGPIVRRGNVFNRGKVSKREGYIEEKRAVV